MIVNEKAISHMIKEAYRTGGVIVARKDGWYIVEPELNRWKLQARTEKMGNKIKSCVVELAGELPEEKAAFLIKKDEKLQRDVELPEISIPYPENVITKYDIRSLVITDGYQYYRVIEDSETHTKTLVTDTIMSIIKNSEASEGPYTTDTHRQRIEWCNEEEVFNIVLASYDEDSEVAYMLNTIDEARL